MKPRVWMGATQGQAAAKQALTRDEGSSCRQTVGSTAPMASEQPAPAGDALENQLVLELLRAPGRRLPSVKAKLSTALPGELSDAPFDHDFVRSRGLGRRMT